MAGELKSENGLGTKVDVDAVRFGANRAAEAQRVKGRLTVRERLGCCWIYRKGHSSR